MPDRNELSLPEELLLLALEDRKGTVASGAMYTYALGGAVLAELSIRGRVGVEQRRKHRYAKVLDPTPTGDALLDEWLAVIGARTKGRTLQDWVGRIAATKDLKHTVAVQLCRRGILRTAEDQVMWIFTRKIYPELDPGAERRLRERLESAIFGDGDVDARTAIVVALGHHSGILRAVFDKKRLKARKDRLLRIADGHATAEATRSAIEALQAALFVSVIVPAVTTT